MPLPKRVPRQEDTVHGLEGNLDHAHPLQPAAGVVRRLQLFMDLLCVGHLSNREASAPPEVSAGGQVLSLPFGAGAGPGASTRGSIK